MNAELEQDRRIGRVRITLLIIAVCLALLDLLVAALSIPFDAPVASPAVFAGWTSGLLFATILFLFVPVLAAVLALFLSLTFVAHNRYWYRLQFLFLILFAMIEGFLFIVLMLEVFEK